MIDHFEIKVEEFERCLRFYSAVLSPLKIECKWSDSEGAGFGEIDSDKVRFVIERSNQPSLTHIAFSAPNKEAVVSFYETGLSAGERCNGKPGLRKNYSPNYFAAFLLDPDGNNVEAVVYV